ncbi:MAG TPA: DUF3426 domain-containing protein [Stellaceae bacterium]|nr:DUF3426 domain-containing protein [Stellaceae bacterium]
MAKSAIIAETESELRHPVMILVCPTCHTRYKVEDEAVSRPSGRMVRCASCGHNWRHMPATPAPPPTTAPATPPTAPLRLRERLSAAAEEPAATPRPAITAPPPPRRHSGLGWVIFILLIGAAIVAVIVAREQIVARWPIVNKLYDLVGLKTEPLGAGLEITNVNSTRNPDGLIVEGDITNKTPVPRNVPHLRVGLRDASKHELVFKIVEPPREKLLPGETSHFTVGFLPAPDAASGVVVTFVGG